MTGRTTKQRQYLHPDTSVVFLALSWSASDALDLAGLLGTFDFLNRATLTRAEIEDHLNALLSAGLVEVTAHANYAIPRAVREQFREFRQRRRKDRFADAAAFVRRHRWTHPPPRIIRISDAVFRRAVAINRDAAGSPHR